MRKKWEKNAGKFVANAMHHFPLHVHYRPTKQTCVHNTTSIDITDTFTHLYLQQHYKHLNLPFYRNTAETLQIHVPTFLQQHNRNIAETLQRLLLTCLHTGTIFDDL